MSSPNVRRLSRADLYAVFKTEQAVRLVEELINAINDVIPADLAVVDGKISDHIADPADAHQASAIGATPAGGLSSITVAGQLAELDAEKVPTTRTVNGHALSADVTVTASDVGAVPTTRNVNGHPLSADVTVTAADVGAPSGSGTSSGTNTGDQTITLTGDVTGSGTGSFAATIPANTVTYAKLQDTAAASVLLGRGAGAGAGDLQEITLGSGLSMTGTTISATAASAGDVVGPASAVANNVVLFNGTTGKLIKDAGAALNAAGVGLGNVTNDAQTKAAIVPNTAPAAGQVLVGNAGGTAYAPVALSGDATLASTGVLTLTGRRVLANVTLGSAGVSLSSGTITACKFLEVHIYVPAMAASDTPSLQFNATGTTDYRYRWLTSAAGLATFAAGAIAISTDRIKISALDSVRTRRVVAFISNDSAIIEKLVDFKAVMGTNSAATQGTIQLGDGAWVTGAATQITQIDLISTSNMNAGTQMTVFGWN